MHSMRDWVIFVVHGTGAVMQILPLDDSCVPYHGGSYEGHCGGCTRCLSIQVGERQLVVQSHTEPEICFACAGSGGHYPRDNKCPVCVGTGVKYAGRWMKFADINWLQSAKYPSRP